MKRTVQLVIAAVMAVTVLTMAPVANVDAKRGGGKPSKESFGSTRLFAGFGPCGAPTADLTVILTNGYANTVYTVEVNGQTATFTTDASGYAGAVVPVVSPRYAPNVTDVTFSARSVSQTKQVQFYCY